MDINRARDFLRANHYAVLTTFFPDGRPQQSPVLVGLDDVGRAIISTRETAVKTHNLARDPRALLCAFTDAFIGPWMLVEGDAEILSGTDAVEPLVEYYRGISGEHPDWDDYRAVMVRDKRVLVRITITKAGPDQQG
jgi:PPOX class probable F420-dependent enzyme